MRRTIENGFELTGPIARGDAPSSAPLAVIRRRRPELEPLYDVLADATRSLVLAVKVARRIEELRTARAAAPAGRVGLVPTMGAFHGGHLSLFPRRPGKCDVVVVSLFVNPRAVRRRRRTRLDPRDEDRDIVVAREAGVDVLFAPAAKEMYPEGYATWVDVEGAVERARGRPPPRSLPRRRNRVPEAVQPRPARPGLLRAPRTPSRWVLGAWSLDLALDVEVTSSPPCATRTGSPCPRAMPAQSPGAARRPPGLAPSRREIPRRARELLRGLDVDYVEVADFHPPSSPPPFGSDERG